jgi:hypothetical protein
MNNQNLNFLVFILVLFLICYLMSKKLEQENFSSKFVEAIDIARTRPDDDLISLKKDTENGGWKKYYRDNYLKGDMEFPDNFDGTVIRNYLDNLKFLKN